MQVQELIDILKDMNPNAEVRLAMQPKWPIEYSIDQVVELPEMEEPDTGGETTGPNYDRKEDYVVYLSEGIQLGYLPDYVCEQLNWR